MTPEDINSIDDVEDEVNERFAELLEQHGYMAVVAGTALALAGLALDLPPDADLTDDEQAELVKLFDQVSEPLKAVIKVRLKAMGMDGMVAPN
jgi:hypothetical protein